MLLRGIAQASPNPTLFHVGPAFVGAEKASRGRIWPDRIWLTQPNPSQISYIFSTYKRYILHYKQYLAGPILLQMSLRVNFVHSLSASFSQDYIKQNTSRKCTNYYCCCTLHRQSENSEYFCILDIIN